MLCSTMHHTSKQTFTGHIQSDGAVRQTSSTSQNCLIQGHPACCAQLRSSPAGLSERCGSKSSTCGSLIYYCQSHLQLQTYNMHSLLQSARHGHTSHKHILAAQHRASTSTRQSSLYPCSFITQHYLANPSCSHIAKLHAHINSQLHAPAQHTMRTDNHLTSEVCNCQHITSLIAAYCNSQHLHMTWCIGTIV